MVIMKVGDNIISCFGLKMGGSMITLQLFTLNSSSSHKEQGGAVIENKNDSVDSGRGAYRYSGDTWRNTNLTRNAFGLIE